MGTKEAIIEGLESGLFKTQKEVAEFYKVSEEYVSQVITKHKNKAPKKLKDNGEFDLKTYLRGNLPQIAQKLVEVITTSTNAKAIELALKALGELVEKREETHKFELTPADYANIGRATINGLREEFIQLGGRCPVCFQLKTLRNEARLDTEPEQPEDREVATVAVPARPG